LCVAELSGVNLRPCSAPASAAAQFIGVGRCDVVGTSQQALVVTSGNETQLCSSCGTDECVSVRFEQCTAYGTAGQWVASPVALVTASEQAVPSMGVFLIGVNETCVDATRDGTPLQLLFRTCFHQSGGSLLFAAVDLAAQVMQLCVFDKASGNAHDRCEAHLVSSAAGSPACYTMSYQDDSCAVQSSELLFAARTASNPKVEAFGIVGILLLSACILCVMVLVVLLYKRQQRKASAQYQQMDTVEDL
jgi:hypothetical protein